jgi:hypothetical protein
MINCEAALDSKAVLCLGQPQAFGLFGEHPTIGVDAPDP